MTEHRLGNEEEARGLLAEADQLIEELASQNLAGLTLRLHREAEALINGEAETQDAQTEDSQTEATKNQDAGTEDVANPGAAEPAM